MALLDSDRLLRAGFERVAVIGVVAAVVLAAAGGTAYALTPRFSAGHTHSHATAAGVGHTHKPANAAGTGTLGTGVGQAHNHDQLAEQAPYIVPTPAERATLAQQLVDARAVALRYPTVADATRAGMILAGGFAPGSGAHYIRFSGSIRGINPDGSVDASNPGSLIYDGTSPTSRVIGVMYTSLGVGAAPAGFAGLNDHWHRHANVCVQYRAGQIQVPFPADRDITRAMCDAVQGTFMKQTVWMVHAWVVPGWESPLGVFSHDNPIVRCADGTTHTDKAGFCQGT